MQGDTVHEKHAVNTADESFLWIPQHAKAGSDGRLTKNMAVSARCKDGAHPIKKLAHEKVFAVGGL